MSQADAHFAGWIVESYNNALQVLAPAYGVQSVKISVRNQNVNNAFDITGASIGKAVHARVSAHPFCPHLWDV